MEKRRTNDGPFRRVFSYGEWRYAILVILLLMVAGIAAKLAVEALERHPSLREAQDALAPITITIFSLTFGFLFLTGGFGIWAIRKTNEVEGRRRIGRFVDEMSYLSDALLAVDAKARVTGMNPSARHLAGAHDVAQARLGELFPCLAKQDVAALTRNLNPYEVERSARNDRGVMRALRFRSQHTGEVSLILVSDVTAAKARQAQDIQSNHLQLLGRLARGVAHDFNNVLCAISAQASLVARSAGMETEAASGLDSILALSARGAGLADRLVQLSRIDTDGESVRRVEEHVERAGYLLKTVLDADWKVDVATAGTIQAAPLTGNQLEQIVLSIGLMAADALDEPGVLRMVVGSDPPLSDGHDPTRISITVGSFPDGEGADFSWGDEGMIPADDVGVVASVVRSMLEDLGGHLQVRPLGGGGYAYRITLPTLQVARDRVAAKMGIPDEIRSRLEGCRTLVALPSGSQGEDLDDRLRLLDLHTAVVHSLPDLLERMDAQESPDAMIVDRRLLGGEPNALIRAVVKLHPAAALVVLSETPVLDRVGLPDEIVFEAVNASSDDVIEALARAREQKMTPVMG